MMDLLTVHHLSVAILGNDSTRYANLIERVEAGLGGLSTEELIDK